MSTVKVSTTLTRNYGAWSATFGIETDIDAARGTDVMAERDKHLTLLRAEFLDFEANQLRNLPAAAGRGKSIANDVKGDTGLKRQWVRALGIISETKKGKTYYYAKTAEGTKWSKFGVSLYFDNFEGMTEEEFKKRADKEGQHVLPDDFYVAVVSQEGKPDKAVALAHKDLIDTEV